ncbi:right-handed parallel beta-helix repeat-containing protein, partial [bacterium]|nr:right-handed parallel beta-helix repeat-containing protein [bacterium]
MKDFTDSSGGRFTRGEGEWKPFSIEGIQADFYVAPNGNDNWSGKLPEPNEEGTDGPFATLKRAQEAVRRLKEEVFQEKRRPPEARYIGSSHKYGKGKDIVVLIRGGYYLLEEPLYFGPEDGGERCETDKPSGAFEFNLLKDYYVTYAAYPGEIPIIAGGKRIVNWQKENNRWSAYLTRNEKVESLIVNGRKQRLARIPNEGYFYPTETPTSAEEFRFCKGDIRKWEKLEGNRIIFLLRWHIGINSIREIDEENCIIRLENSQPGLLEVPPRYYVENIEALLDAPGEWYFDIHTGKLLLIPPMDIDDPNNAFIVVPTISSLIVVTGRPDKPVRNLRFYGLYLQGTASGGSAVSFEYAWNCEVLESKFTGLSGIAIKVGKGCFGTRIYKNVIDGADGGGIHINGLAYPERWTDIIDGTVISYNRVSNAGRVAIYSANTLNTTISHNEVKDTAWAIKVGGWSNIEEAIDGGYRVEYNHIHHAMIDADDGGALTVAGQTSNSIIRRNLIHDIQPSYFNENTAFMFDNWSAGWVVEENIYYNLKQAPMKLCAATLADNVYRDNFYIEKSIENEPEGIIDGKPIVEYRSLKINKKEFRTGEVVKISCSVYNKGATGVEKIALFVNGRIVEFRKVPVIKNNEQEVEFDLKLYEPGTYKISVGGLEDLLSSPEEIIEVSGNKFQFVCDKLKLSEESGIIPVGDELEVSAEIKNIGDLGIKALVPLYLNEN